MQLSKIEWTDYTSNPLKYLQHDTSLSGDDSKVVWGCIHKNEDCSHCYAEQLANRYGRGGAFTAPNMARLTPFLDEKELHHIRTYKPASGKRCFLGDMTDIFGEWVSDDLLNHLFSNTLEIRTDVTFQILTKRADRMQKYLSWRWGEGRIPMRNIWVGVSVGSQKRADEMIPLLLKTPLAMGARFVSYEPALGPVDFSEYLNGRPIGSPYPVGLDWIIVGGESGPGARPFDLEWARSVVRQCKAAKVPVFVKQLGAKPVLDGSRYNPYGTYTSSGNPSGTYSRKGGKWSEWPEDLRVREMPPLHAQG